MKSVKKSLAVLLAVALLAGIFTGRYGRRGD